MGGRLFSKVAGLVIMLLLLLSIIATAVLYLLH